MNNKKTKKNYRVAAVIACRLESTRLFAKSLQMIDDKSILDSIIIQLKKSKFIDEIILAISNKIGNEIFVEFAKSKSLKFIVGNEADVLQRIIDAACYVNANLVLRVTSEDPIKHWKAIDVVIKQHIQLDMDLSFTKDLPEGTGFELINLKSLKIAQKKGTKKDREDVTSYLYKNAKSFRIYPYLVKPKFRRPEIRLTVDYPEDLVLIREIFKKVHKISVLQDLEKVINIIDKYPRLKSINQKYANPHRKWL